MMQFDDLFGNRQTKSCAAGVGRTGCVQSVKLLKNPLQLLRRDRLSFVLHTDPDLLAQLRQSGLVNIRLDPKSKE